MKFGDKVKVKIELDGRTAFDRLVGIGIRGSIAENMVYNQKVCSIVSHEAEAHHSARDVCISISSPIGSRAATAAYWIPVDWLTLVEKKRKGHHLTPIFRDEFPVKQKRFDKAVKV